MYDFVMNGCVKIVLKFFQHTDIFLKQNTLYVNGFSRLANIIALSKKSSLIKGHYLIPGPGKGNIGEFAMCDAFASKFNGVCTLVVGDAETFIIPRKYESEIALLEIPKIIYGRFFGNFFALLKLAKHRNQMESLSLIGADVVDGSYNLSASINRLFLLQIMNNLNVPTRILGFSWSAEPQQSAVSLMKKISGRTKLLVRDPRSAERLRASGVFDITDSADIVFSDQNEEALNSVEQWMDSNDNPIVGINISGLGEAFNAQSQAQFDEYINIVKHVKALGYRVLLIPHVFWLTDGDFEISQHLFRSACDDSDFLIMEIFTSAQERKFLRKINFLVTARMHAAIIALSAGVPVIALETMGKVEGLFELFGNKSYCIPRKHRFSDEVNNRIDYLHQNLDQAMREVESRLPSIKALSSRNFEGL
jgi:polysaccharide pyruvyl transferase WcaK-like protein